MCARCASKLVQQGGLGTARYPEAVSGPSVPGGVVHELPADLRRALVANATALAAWEDITPLARNEFICWVEDAKQADHPSAAHPTHPGGVGGRSAPALLLARLQASQSQRQIVPAKPCTGSRGGRSASRNSSPNERCWTLSSRPVYAGPSSKAVPRQAQGAHDLPSATATELARPLFRRAAVGACVLSLIAAVWLVPGATPAGSNGLREPRAASALPPPALLPASAAVGLRVLTFVDHTRVARFHTGAVTPRTLVTQIRYPALGPPGADDLRDAPPLTGAGPFPLIVFGPGFGETPTPYARLLDAWARAGFVVSRRRSSRSPSCTFPEDGASATSSISPPTCASSPRACCRRTGCRRAFCTT